MTTLARIIFGYLWPPLGYRQRVAALLEWERACIEAHPLTFDVYFSAIRAMETERPYLHIDKTMRQSPQIRSGTR